MRTQRQTIIRNLLLVMFMVPFLMAPGCKDKFPAIAKATLETTLTAYDTGFTVMGTLYKDGKMSEEQKNSAIDFGRKFKAAYNVAVDAVAAYVKVADTADSSSAKMIAIQTMVELMTYYDDFIKLIEEVKGSPLSGSAITESDRKVLAGE